ncbi:hypothetical protein BH23ACT11_BH23ACT11_22090 [soil metagenome]
MDLPSFGEMTADGGVLPQVVQRYTIIGVQPIADWPLLNAMVNIASGVS